MVALMRHPAVTSCTDISVQLIVLSPSHRSLAPCGLMWRLFCLDSIPL